MPIARTKEQAAADQIDWNLDYLARHAAREGLENLCLAIHRARVEARSLMHPDDRAKT